MACLSSFRFLQQKKPWRKALHGNMWTLEIGVVNARQRDTPAAKLEPQKQSYMATVRSRIGGGKEYEQLSPVMTLNLPNGKIFNFDEALLGVYELQSFSVSDPQHIKG
uniref:Uncharacterized protein n=1 Tax=Coccidioides posadasii RMSCC 3488 TaxID=454284 RepID=A0A0J6FAY3_COCPO|nr:hypothetical protein CPAG_06473 [Coccidioides posadasii RMSCC 3488]